MEPNISPIDTTCAAPEKEQLKKKYLFIDESGSPEFYKNKKQLLLGHSTTSPVLILGMIETKDRELLRKQIIDFKSQLLQDKALKHIHSLHQPNWFLHARADHPQVKELFFEFMKDLQFGSYAIIGRKKLDVFHGKHKGKTSEFYFDLVKHLTTNRFKHQFDYELYLSGRSKTKLHDFSSAIEKSLHIYQSKVKSEVKRSYKCNILKSSECPELSITDYMIWALQRYILKGEDKYFKMLNHKYGCIQDIYENKKENRYYYKRKPLILENTTPFV